MVVRMMPRKLVNSSTALAYLVMNKSNVGILCGFFLIHFLQKIKDLRKRNQKGSSNHEQVGTLLIFISGNTKIKKKSSSVIILVRNAVALARLF